jgi:drug/metabolite transporter (DMT)-like permease
VPSNRFVAMALLAVIWGSSFVFIRVAVRELDAGEVLASRMLLGALTLGPFALSRFGMRGVWRHLRPIWWQVVVLGVLTFFAPTMLLAWGEQRVDAGLTAVLIASSPLWAAAFALWIVPEESFAGWKLVGLFTGFVGVAFLVGAPPSGDIAGSVALVLVGVFYALATLLTDGWLAGVPLLASTFGIFCIGTIVVVPVAAAGLPSAMPSASVVGAVLAFGIVNTGIAFLLFVGLVVRWGAGFGILVNYLSPAVTLVLGAILLNEDVTAVKLAGLVLVLLGVTLGSGAVGRRKREPVVAEAQAAATTSTSRSTSSSVL